MDQIFADLFSLDGDHTLVVQEITTNPCDFLIWSWSVIASDASSDDKCLTVIMSRYAFNLHAVPPDILDNDTVMEHSRVLLALMHGTDEALAQHASVSMAVFAEYFLQLDPECNILDELMQSEHPNCWLALAVVTREMELGTNCLSFIPHIINALQTNSPICKHALEVASNIVAEFPKDFVCPEFWLLMVATLESPEYCSLCIEVFIYARKCHLLMLGDTYLDVINMCITQAMNGICSKVSSVRFLLNASYSLQKGGLVLPDDAFLAAVDLAMLLLSEEDVETTEESSEGFGRALLQSLLWMRPDAFQSIALGRIESGCLCNNVLLTLTYMLVHADMLTDVAFLEMVIELALSDMPRVVILGLELVQLIIEKECRELNYGAIFEVCKAFLEVDFACQAASVTVYAICQVIEVDVDDFCWNLFTYGWRVPVSIMAPVVLDLISLLVPDVRDPMCLLVNTVPVIEAHVGAYRDTEIMQSACNFVVEMSKQVEFPDEVLDHVFMILLELQNSEINAGCAVATMGKIAMSVGERFAPFVEPCVMAIIGRFSQNDAENAFLAWRLLRMARLCVNEYETAVHECMCVQ